MGNKQGRRGYPGGYAPVSGYENQNSAHNDQSVGTEMSGHSIPQPRYARDHNPWSTNQQNAERQARATMAEARANKRRVKPKSREAKLMHNYQRYESIGKPRTDVNKPNPISMPTSIGNRLGNSASSSTSSVSLSRQSSAEKKKHKAMDVNPYQTSRQNSERQHRADLAAARAGKYVKKKDHVQAHWERYNSIGRSSSTASTSTNISPSTSISTSTSTSSSSNSVTNGSSTNPHYGVTPSAPDYPDYTDEQLLCLLQQAEDASINLLRKIVTKLIAAPRDETGTKYRKVKKNNRKIQAPGVTEFLLCIGFEVRILPNKQNIPEEFLFFDIFKNPTFDAPQYGLNQLNYFFPPQNPTVE